MSETKKTATKGHSRREFVGLGSRTVAATFTALGAPRVWTPKKAFAQSIGRGRAKHLLYIRLSGGFRFSAAFNADVASSFNPFGQAAQVSPGTEWGVGRLLARAPYLQGDDGAALRELGVQPVTSFSHEISVLPCVDHEPGAGRADGNHGSALERFFTGYVGGDTGFLTMVNFGLRERETGSTPNGTVRLPAFSLGSSGIGRGSGEMAAYRPAVLSGNGFDRFRVRDQDAVPGWATELSRNNDVRLGARLHARGARLVQRFGEAREATKAYAAIFNSDILKIGNNDETLVDGFSQPQLRQIFGDSRGGRNVRLALRLFHFGSPAVYFDQGDTIITLTKKNVCPHG